MEQKDLFDGLHPESHKYRSSVHLAQIIGIIGPPPKELLDRGDPEIVKRYFDDNGMLLFSVSSPLHVDDNAGDFKYDHLIPVGRTLGDTITMLEEEEKERLLSFAKRLLRWLPEDRPSAKELIEDPWLELPRRRGSSTPIFHVSLGPFSFAIMSDKPPKHKETD